MDSKLIFAIVLVVILIVFIFMLNSNTVMKGVMDGVFGIKGQINAEMFSTAGVHGGSQFVPAYDEKDLDDTYESRGNGPSSSDNYSEPSPLSPYDGLQLGADKEAASKVMENQTLAKHRVASLSKKPMLVLLGSGAPPAHEMQPAQPDPYQTLPVDGNPGSPKSMFMLSHNTVSMDCCPSQYTTDLGCVCLTPEQKNWVSKRGENRNAPSEY